MAVNLDTYAPFDDGPGANTTESGWRAFMRRLSNSGVIRDVGNSLSVYADSTGMQVKVRTGEVWIEGHWGAVTVEKVCPVAAAHATLARVDRVVARADFTNNRIEVDVVAGSTATPTVPPDLTQNTTIWETSLATVSVPAADTGIDAAQVTDARTYGGPTSPTLADDFTVYGDKLSSCPRQIVTTGSAATNGIIYVVRFSALRSAQINKLRLYVGTDQTGGTVQVKVYAGYHQRYLRDITGGTSVAINTIGNPASIHEGTLPATATIQAGQNVAVAYCVTGASVSPNIGVSVPVVHEEMLNQGTVSSDPATRWVTAYKSGSSLPTVIDILDGTWTRRDRLPWVALG